MIIWKKKLIECCKCHKKYSFDDNLFYHLKEYILVCPNCNLMHEIDIRLLGKEYEGLKKIDKLNLTAIDIGSEATNRTNYQTAGNTLIATAVKATATGKITSVEIWANTTMQGVKVGIFTQISANHFTARDFESLEDIPSASKVVRTVSLDVVEGDYIGVYYTAGRLDNDVAGSGFWYSAGNQTECVDRTFNFTADRTLSLHGIGATLGWPHKWNGVTIGKLNGAVISKWNGIA